MSRVQLKASVHPGDAANREVVWSSSDERVAMVEEGLVIPLAPGHTVITVSTVEATLPIAVS